MPDNIDSPCIRNCCLDDHDICLGCFRSLQEIRDWSLAAAQDRNRILLNAEKRREERELKMNESRKGGFR